MVFARTFRRFRQDESGAAFLEFTVTMTTFFLLTMGTVDLTYAFYQWNAATKAVQLGARIAAVSDPVWQELPTITGLDGGALPGDPMPSFDVTCTGAGGGSCPGGTYDANAMNALVYGLSGSSCDATDPLNPWVGMCDIFDRIQPQNVVVRYQYTGLGYAGRPGGPVPTVTVSLTGLTFNFFFLDGFLGSTPVIIPGLNTTMTGEDLNVSGS